MDKDQAATPEAEPTTAGVLRVEFAERQRRNMRMAAEFGFKGHERGWNLERTLAEFDSIMTERK